MGIQLINIVVTSKPVDGLLYYSYEYCDMLNKAGHAAQVLIISHRKFKHSDYINTIKQKYIHCKNVIIDLYEPNEKDITLIMGRSMMTLSWQDFQHYTPEQQKILKNVFKNKVISVYSENHPQTYPKAVEFYNPKKIIDLCDKDVYPNGVGKHFEKTINFSIYKPYVENKKFKYLFLGTNDKYYATIEKVIDKFPDHGILTYDNDYVNVNNNNVFVPVENLMGMFETYVYTKDTFDPAPRIFQECKYYNKDVVYLRDKNMKDGGSVYWERKNVTPDIKPIMEACND